MKLYSRGSRQFALVPVLSFGITLALVLVLTSAFTFANGPTFVINSSNMQSQGWAFINDNSNTPATGIGHTRARAIRLL